MASKELLGGDDYGGMASRRVLQVMSPSQVSVDGASTALASVRKSSRSRSASRTAAGEAPSAGSNPTQSSAGRNPSPTMSRSATRSTNDVGSSKTKTAISRIQSEGPSQGREAFTSPTKAILRSEVEEERAKQIYIEQYADACTTGAKQQFIRVAQQYEQAARDVKDVEVAEARMDAERKTQRFEDVELRALEKQKGLLAVKIKQEVFASDAKTKSEAITHVLRVEQMANDSINAESGKAAMLECTIQALRRQLQDSEDSQEKAKAHNEALQKAQEANSEASMAAKILQQEQTSLQQQTMLRQQLLDQNTQKTLRDQEAAYEEKLLAQQIDAAFMISEAAAQAQAREAKLLEMQNEIETMKRFQEEQRSSAGRNSLQPVAGSNPSPPAETQHKFLGCGPADPDEQAEEDVHFQDADEHDDDEEAQKELARLLKANQLCETTAEEPKKAAVVESSSEIEELKKMMQELTLTVAKLAARSTTTSSAGSNTSPHVAGRNTQRDTDPAGVANEDRQNTEFFNMYDDDDKTEKKEDQTTSENSRMDPMLEKLFLKGKENPEANFVQFTSFPTSAQLQVWKTDFMYKVAAAAKDPQDAFQWANEIDRAKTADDLAENGTLYKKKYASLESKIASGLFGLWDLAWRV